MNATITNLSIKISPRAGGRYKSISSLSWLNIPGLAILTGRNGSGKTQLLEVLAYHLSDALPQEARQTGVLPVEVTFEGTVYKSEQIAYVPSSGRFSGGALVSLASLPQARQQVLSYAQQAHAHINDITNTIKSKRATAILGGRDPNSMTPDELQRMFGDDFEFMLDDVDVTTGLTYVFVAYRMKFLESLERGAPGLNSEGQPLGPAPWEIVNQSLVIAGFPYQVISPTETSFMEAYELKLRDSRSGVEIRALDLSSGEQVILQMILWLYSSGKVDVFPKLLILDEPDAHLHPSMATQFLDVISEVLVNRYGVRIIMTTHSASTVALAPEGSIFRMERGTETIEKVTNRADMISDLTAGLVTVSRSTKFCFVEDEDDVEFYDAVREILTDYGPSRDPLALKPSPSIVFIPASSGSGVTKISGGSTVVEKWVARV
jgi:ABC-type multidrug transport system ATPase subunit